MLPIVIKILLVIHVLVSLLIILLVLMQRPKNEGLGAAFGGGATDQLFGAQTTNVLQLITRWLGGIFFGLTLLLSILYVKQGGGRSPIQEKLSAKTKIPAPTPAAALEKSDDPTSPPVQLPQPGPDGEKMPDKPAPAPGADKAAESPAPAAPPVPPPAENKPADAKPAENKSDAPAPAAPPVPPPADGKPVERAPEPNPADPAK